MKQLSITNAIAIAPKSTKGHNSIAGASGVNIEVYGNLEQVIKKASNTDNISAPAFPARCI